MLSSATPPDLEWVTVRSYNGIVESTTLLQACDKMAQRRLYWIDLVHTGLLNSISFVENRNIDFYFNRRYL